jgi:hypothetical protein
VNCRGLRRRCSQLAALQKAHTRGRLDEWLAGSSCSLRVERERSGSRVILSAEEKPEGSGPVLRSPPECQPYQGQCKTTTRAAGRSPRSSPCQSVEGTVLNPRRGSEPICQWPRHDGSMASGCAFSKALALLTCQPPTQSHPYIKVTRYHAPTPIDSWVGRG